MSSEMKAVFLIALICTSFIAWLVVDTYKLFSVDALARTFQIATVLYNEPPKLANMGFAWPPISVLIQLPFVLIRPLAKAGMTGPLVTAVFAAVNLTLMNRILKGLVGSQLLRYVVLALYQTTSIILIYSVNGMSEMILLCWVLVGVHYLQQLISGRAKDVYALTMIGVSSSLAILTRYEGIVLGLALYGVCLCYWLSAGANARQQSNSHSQPGAFAKMEAGTLYLLAPMVYSIGLWLFFNWLIIGDPFYFIIGMGSNAELMKSNVPNSALLASLKDDIYASLQYVISLAWHMYPGLFVALPGLGLLALWRRSFYAVGIAAVALAFLLHQVALLYIGQSFGFMRYIIYVVPLAVVGLTLIGKEIKRAGILPAWFVDAGLIAVLAASSFSSYASFNTATIVQTQDKQYVDLLQTRRVVDTLAADQEVATYISTNLLQANPTARILTDEQQAFALLLSGDNYRHFVTRRQLNFASILEQPQGNVDYILIPDVHDGTNQINLRYPGMYAGNVPFVELVRTFPGSFFGEWRLFRVLPPGQQVQPPAAAEAVAPASPSVAVPDGAVDANTWPKIAEEQFDQPSERFPVVQRSSWSNTYQDGRYYTQVHGRAGINYGTVPVRHDFWLKADVQIERGQAGLFFLIEESNDLYRFLIDTAGRYRLEVQQSGVPEILIDWTEGTVLQQGAQAVNRIEVRRIGDELALYANEILLTTYDLPSDSTNGSARIGLALDAPPDTDTGSAWFDNLIVHGPMP